jgi:uncharacterized protein YkwD
MKRQVVFKVLCVVFLLALLLPGASQARQVPATLAAGDYVPGEVLVKFRLGVMPVAVSGGVEMGVASLDALARQYGVTAAEPLFASVGYSAQGLERIYKLSLPATADVLAAAGALAADVYVEYAEPNYIYHVTGDPIEVRHGQSDYEVASLMPDLDLQLVLRPHLPSESEEEQIVTLINEYRQQNDLGPLSLSPTLTDAADWFAHDTYSGTHTDSLGRGITERVQSFGYSDWATEVIFNGSDGSAQTALNWWKGSSSHNAELLRGDHLS